MCACASAVVLLLLGKLAVNSGVLYELVLLLVLWYCCCWARMLPDWCTVQVLLVCTAVAGQACCMNAIVGVMALLLLGKLAVRCTK